MYWLASCLVRSDEIRLYEIDMLRSCIELRSKTRIAPTEATGVYPFDLYLKCAEYGVQNIWRYK